MSKLHQYAVLGHSPEKIGRLLGIASLLMAPWLSSGLSHFFSFVVSSPLQIGIAAGSIYAVLHWLFNNIIWRWALFRKATGIPDLNGKWDVSGQTLREDGKVTHEWSSTWEIEQTWKGIVIFSQSDKSESYSYTCALSQLFREKWRMSYSYKNEPKPEFRKEMQAHKGYCELTFEKGFLEAEGEYFSSQGRRTCGHMKLTKKEI